MRAHQPGQSALLLLDIIEILNRFNIPYAVVGAFAASFYGVVRASMDADAVISLNRNTIKSNELVDEFRKTGLTVNQRIGDLSDPIQGVITIQDIYDNKVDLLLEIRGMNPDAFSRTCESIFMDLSIRIIGAEDFVAMKVFAGSPKDIEDAKGALKISGANINISLLKNLTLNYGKKEFEKLVSILKECNM